MMTWTALLMADSSPCLRSLVLRQLLNRGADDSEVCELLALRERDSLVADLLQMQEADGFWRRGDMAWSAFSEPVRATSLALMRLGYLGFEADHPAIRRGAEALFSVQRADGAWPLGSGDDETGETDRSNEGYSMIPLQTALPLRALAACGYATDPKAERAYEWLLAQRLPDGAWPTGLAAGTFGRVAGYRRLAHSRWGCRANTTAALLCLAYHPQRRNGVEAQRGLDLLLGRETYERHTLGFEVARLLGMEAVRGRITFHARFDLALILDLAWRIGASLEDERLASMLQFVREQQGAYGLWEYPARPQATRWITFDLLRSLSRLDQTTAWVSMEPRTPFQAYSSRKWH